MACRSPTYAILQELKAHAMWNSACLFYSLRLSQRKLLGDLNYRDFKKKLFIQARNWQQRSDRQLSGSLPKWVEYSLIRSPEWGDISNEPPTQKARSLTQETSTEFQYLLFQPLVGKLMRIQGNKIADPQFPWYSIKRSSNCTNIRMRNMRSKQQRDRCQTPKSIERERIVMSSTHDTNKWAHIKKGDRQTKWQTHYTSESCKLLNITDFRSKSVGKGMKGKIFNITFYTANQNISKSTNQNRVRGQSF